MLPDWIIPELERLLALAGRDQLPHALLIHGPPGTGRRWLALALVRRLLNLDAGGDDAALAPGGRFDEERVPAHADLSVVQPPTGKRVIPVDRIRDLIAFLNLTSGRGGYKAALLNPAHAMNRNAANSLLKTLEEPPGRSLIVLISDALSRLPPTVVSRCHRIRVPLPARERASAWLRDRDAAADWDALLDLAGGAPIRALEYGVAGVPAQIGEFERDVEALAARRATPVAVAKRWAKADPELCLTWLYQRISREAGVGLADPQSRRNSRIGDLKNGAENLSIERAHADLRQVGELRRLQGSGLNQELQLAAVLARWHGDR